MIESHFGESAPLTVGIEEELMLLDAETLQPVDAVGLFIGDAEGGRMKTELHASVVELNTDICAGVDEAIDALRSLRGEAARVAAANGLAIAAAGAHPTATFESLPIVQEERYLAMLRDVGYAASRQGVNGLHVHVGMASADECYDRMEAVLPWLPAVLALSANSPFLEGAATGMLSNRALVLSELPRAGAPPVFGSYSAWEAWAERLVALGVMDDYTRLWWDVRPHPRFGTLEVRIADQPTSLERTALVARTIVDLVASAPSRESMPRGDYLQNRWAAAQLGLDARLIHPDGERMVTARELVDDPPEPEALRQLELGPERATPDVVTRTLG
ncbi:MAG TPA: YbdK family carboxylate-amine ligase [Gaiellaceae bacterium]|nr:YbdK family carboxylate-amine ligase [Gaiellaceae bacterium]